MNDQTLTEFLGDFTPTETGQTVKIREGIPVTIWLPVEYKQRYDKLQAATERRFGKKTREALMALIDIAETRVG